MINRVFKTIFILTLCLGITLPSNAAGVQVSDGSAFITKSEMAYQLNNLSNRMAQLENSLDSKIDTLVSSYLTRNGIWNGSPQQLLEGGYIRKDNGKFELYNPPVTFATKPAAKFADNIYGESDFFTANKSGLMCVSVGTSGGRSGTTYSTDNRRFFCYFLSNNSNITSYDGTVYASEMGARSALLDWSAGCYFGWEIIDGEDIKSAVNLITYRPCEAPEKWMNVTGSYTTGYVVIYGNFYQLMQFFVEKGKTYKQRLRFKYNQGGVNTPYFSFTVGDNYGLAWRMGIDYASVY